MSRPPGADASLCGGILLSAGFISSRRTSLRTNHETVPRQVGRARCPVLSGTQLPRPGCGRLGQRTAEAVGRKIPGYCAFQRGKEPARENWRGETRDAPGSKCRTYALLYFADCTPIGESAESCRWTNPFCPRWIVPPPFRHGIAPVFCQLSPRRLVLIQARIEAISIQLSADFQIS